MSVYDQGLQKSAEIMRSEAKLRHPSRKSPTPTTYHELQRQRDEQALVKPEAGALNYPRQPASSPWSGTVDRAPDAGLGYSIDAVEPCGEPHEVAMALRERGDLS